jgi:Flp pilus assembly protein TadD
LYLFEGEAAKGRQILEDGLKKFHTAELYNSLGLAMFKTGQLDEALALFREGMSRHPDHVELLMNIGNVYAMRMDYQEADAVFNRCARLNPADPMIPYWRGCVLAANRAFPEAEAQLHRAIDLQPNLAIAYHQLAKVLERSGHGDQARMAFQTAVQIDPKLGEEA